MALPAKSGQGAAINGQGSAMVTSFRRMVNRVRTGRDSSQPEEMAFTFSMQDMELIEGIVRLQKGEMVFKARPFTDDEIIEAAWASLKIEEPDTTREQVRRAILEGASALQGSSALSRTSEAWKPETSPA